jgi:hypothetical protein
VTDIPQVGRLGITPELRKTSLQARALNLETPCPRKITALFDQNVLETYAIEPFHSMTRNAGTMSENTTDRYFDERHRQKIKILINACKLCHPS